MRLLLGAAGCTTLLGAGIGPAGADSRRYELNDGLYHASAVFEQSGADLYVTLTNTCTDTATTPERLLTGLFFDTKTPLALTKDWAKLAASSTVLNATLASSWSASHPDLANGVEDGIWLSPEWAYNTRLTSNSFFAEYGISSTGIGLFAPSNRFDTKHDLDGPADPDGPNYGIVGKNVTAEGLTGADRKKPEVSDGVVFHFTGYTGALDNIRNVKFQYSTTLDPHSATSKPPDEVPEPAVVQLASLLALSGVGLWRARARKV